MNQQPWQISDSSPMQNQIVEEVSGQNNTQIQDQQQLDNTSPIDNNLGINSYNNMSYGGMGYGGMGFGGMGMGMGMYGLGMSGMDQNGFLFQSLRALESASFMVNSLAQLTRTMECNAQGFYNLFSSIIGLFTKIKNWIISGLKSIKNITVKSVDFVLIFLKFKQKIEENQEEFLGLSDTQIELEKLRKKEKILKQIFNVTFGTLFIVLIFVNFWNYYLSKQIHTKNTGINPVSLFTH